MYGLCGCFESFGATLSHQPPDQLGLPPPLPSHRDLHSYLLGDQEESDNNGNPPANNNAQPRNNNNALPVAGEGLHAAHQAILQQGGPVGFQPYHRPMRFPFRVSVQGDRVTQGAWELQFLADYTACSLQIALNPGCPMLFLEIYHPVSFHFNPN